MGAVFALFAGFYYWTPKIVGRNINDLLGKIHFWTLFIGVKQIVQNFIYLIIYLVNILLLSKHISIRRNNRKRNYRHRR
jgi:heme/copper-type cytochrome/quinol oxidase subunit 1